MSTFRHATELWQRFPALAVGVVWTDGIDAGADVGDIVGPYEVLAAERLRRTPSGTESGLDSVAAWRRVYAELGYKPTRYRSAAESLLRRLRKEGALPRLHPLVDLCNALSAAYAIPIAVLDREQIDGGLTVGPAAGTESYRTFGGDVERPEPGEIVYADRAGNAHARRWVNRQSGRSAVGRGTTSVLIVAEAVHATAEADVGALCGRLKAEIDRVWGVDCTYRKPSAAVPIVELPD